MSTTTTNWLQVCRDPAVEMVARILAKHADGVDPGDTLEPGNAPFPDHTEVTDGCLRGASAFFRWRQFVARAKEIVDAVRETTPATSRVVAALRQIANEDYRGNRPNSARVAENALREAGLWDGEP